MAECGLLIGGHTQTVLGLSLPYAGKVLFELVFKG